MISEYTNATLWTLEICRTAVVIDASGRMETPVKLLANLQGQMAMNRSLNTCKWHGMHAMLSVGVKTHDL